MARILLVEDNEMNRDMLARRLTRKGFEVLFAEDGRQAIDITSNESPDLVLMDMSLPIMDGWEATRLIKGDEALKNIPIIGLSAHAMSGDREKGIAAGCDEYETKPVDFPALLEKINMLLPG